MKPLRFYIRKNYKNISLFEKKHHSTHPVISANDERLVINFYKAGSLDKIKDFITYYLPIFAFMVIFFLLMFFLVDKSGTPKDEVDIFFLYIVLAITALVFMYLLKCLVVYLFSFKKKVVLDRINCTITYPKTLFSSSCITIPFKELKLFDYDFVNYRIYDVLGKYFYKNKMIKRNEGDYIMYWLFYKTFYKKAVLSNIVWYMDKNRPLPPGELFVPFRKKDYKRRKNEGFNPPLFKSYIPTPEYIYEHQKEPKESLKKPFISLKDSFDIFYSFKFKNQHQIQCRNLIFDRDRGVILFQDSKSNGKIKGYYFNNLKFSSCSTCLYNLKEGLHFLLYEEDIEYVFDKENLSAITWYMDKNRPLPPVPGFDRIRQQDYERRKEEGFPEPLYESRFPTPEAIPEQQEERERIGGW